MSDTNITGYLRYPVEMRFTANGKAISHFDIYDKDYGEWTKKQRVVCWELLGEAVNRELSESSKVFAKGYLKTRRWEGQDGESHEITELIANRVWELDDTPEEMSHPREIKFEVVTKFKPPEKLPNEIEPEELPF